MMPTAEMGGAQKVAFVLGGGGMLGSAEVGMLRSLLERGISPDLIVGSSVGALNGVFVAAEPTVDGVESLSEIWLGLTKREIFGGSLVSQIGTLARHGTYLHSNDPLRKLLADGLGTKASFQDLSVAFQCVAASIERAAPRWFSSGPLVESVLASCAVPGLLPAVELDGEHYFDGGLIRSVPIGRAIELGATRVYVLHVGRLEVPLEVPTKPWEVATVAFEIARRHHFEEEMATVPEGVEVHVLPSGSQAPRITVRYRSTSEVKERIDSAYQASSQFLDAMSV
jgi:NTE family protein